MSGIQKTINRGGFDLGFWSIIDGSFNKMTGKFHCKFVGYKDKATYDLGPGNYYKGGEISKVMKLSDYDGSNFITWLYNQALLPIYDEELNDLNIFKDGLLIG